MLLTELSILALYMRLPSFSKRGRIVSYVLICVATLNALSGMTVNFVLKHLSDVARDRGLLILWYINSGLSLPIDFTIWFLPIPMVFRLQKLDRKKRIGLFLNFSLGLMCPITALGRLCVVKEASKIRGDLAWNMAYIYILTTTEVGIAICAVSMVGLRPLLTLFLDWCNGTPGSLSRTKSSWSAGTPFSEGTRRVQKRPESGVYDTENEGDLQITKGGTPGSGTGLSKTQSAVDRTGRGSESEIYDMEHDLHQVKVVHHTDIELGTVNASTEAILPTLPSPPPPVSPRVTNSNISHKCPGTRFSGILQTLKDSHIPCNDRNTIDTTPQ